MGFFDLNIPCTESNKRNSTVEKSLRLKLAVKAMELGYTGVAYNRTITGVMSEADRCSISLFPLSSVLKVSPFISSSVNLHRRLLNVPTSTPFRQYTRLTVVVDSPAQGSSLNSGNPILKTYDIVAVRPLKQESFDQACKNYEVDIIAIDFSENRFRLKQPLIKAAIERGVCFEITYSGLLMDAQLRRQIISHVKLLVDWTRGKNLIFSSAAPSVTELRGPYDVANLAFLLGISNQHAKASVSRTCRSLLESAIRKKKFHKETIRVELLSSAELPEQNNIEGAGFDDWLKWDPISSGDGDLQLDDMAKSFAASGKESKTKAIDFVSIIEGLPSHGLHIKDIKSETKLDPYGGSRDLSAATKAEKLADVDDVAIDSELNGSHNNRQTSVMETLENGHLLNLGNCDISSGIGACEAVDSVKESEPCLMSIDEETKITSDSNICFSGHEAEQQNLQGESHEALTEENVSEEKEIGSTCNARPISGTSISDDNPSTLQSKEAGRLPYDASLHEEFLEGELMTDTRDVAVTPVSSSLNEDVPIPEELMTDARDVVVTPVGSSLNENVPIPEELMTDTGDVAVTPVSSSLNQDGPIPKERLSVIVEDVSLATLSSHDELQNAGANSVAHEPLEDQDVSMKIEVESKGHNQMNRLYAQESSSERIRRKRGGSQSLRFPFKRLLKPSTFKKARKLKTNHTILSLHELIG